MAADDAGPTTFVLSGPANLYEAEEIREALQAVVAEANDLRIDLETAGPWDVAGLQLLIAALASGAKTGHTVRLINVPRVCVEIAERSGLSDWLIGAADSFL